MSLLMEIIVIVVSLVSIAAVSQYTTIKHRQACSLCRKGAK